MIDDFLTTLHIVAQYAAIVFATAVVMFMLPLCSALIVTSCLHALAGKTDADDTPYSNLCELAATFVGIVVFVAVAIPVFRWFPFV